MSEPLTILGWLWRQPSAANQYDITHANQWARMIHRNLTLPHRFLIATDWPRDTWHQFDPLIRPVELWDDWRQVNYIKWPDHKPQCYVRLKAFSAEAREMIGPRFVSIDLDCIVVDNLDPLLSRPEDFLIYHRDPQPQTPEYNRYQGSLWMLTAGARRQVWDDFRGAPSMLEMHRWCEKNNRTNPHHVGNVFIGSDQAWIRYKLGPDEAGWSQRDGVWSYLTQIRTTPAYYFKPPPGARLIFFNGSDKPWHLQGFQNTKYFDWVKECYFFS